MICKGCGRSVDDSVFMCEHCGTLLKSGHVVLTRQELATHDTQEAPASKSGRHTALRIVCIVAVVYLIVVAVFAIVSHVTGQSLLLGVWENEDVGCISFQKGGVYSDIRNDVGSYRTEDGKLFLVDSAGQEAVYRYEYQFGMVKDTLKLENDEECIVFHRYR